MHLTNDDFAAMERELCRRSFAAFIRRAWPNIIPDKLQWNWHLDAEADHLQAVADGQIKRLLINVPPGTSKSTVTGVMFPAWLWGPGGKPGNRYIGAAHEQGLAVRDNRLCRELVTSEWYQSLWPLGLKSDQNEKLYFENEHRGFRQACAIASMTGRRGHCLTGDTVIATDTGERTIRDIAESAETCNVLSYDIHSRTLVQRPVQAVARGSSRHIYRIHFTSGRVVTCSRDHKFYTDRGYVEARLLSEGDACVRLVQDGVHQDSCGGEEDPSQHFGRPLLQHVMLDQRNECADRQYGTVLHCVRSEDQEGKAELLGSMQDGIAQARRGKDAGREGICSVRNLLDADHKACDIEAALLLSGVCLNSPQNAHIWGEQSSVEWRGGQSAASAQWVTTGVDSHTDKNCGSRPWEVRRLRVAGEAARSSHRCKSHEQRGDEPSDAMREVPLPMAWGTQITTAGDTVAVVERLCGERDTYDIQVGGTHCFFANGILVHNCIVWDDPLSPEKANSEVHRQEAIRILTETVPTRLNDPENSAIIVVMQRLHENDPSGYILANELGYEHLLIPMEFEPDRRVYTSIGWTDPRTKDGELLDPVRFPQHVIDRDKKAMGSYAWAGQMQQRPAPRGGGLLRDEWWVPYKVTPKLKWRGVWADTAQKTGTHNDYSVLQCWGESEDGKAVFLDQIRGKWEAPELLTHARAFWAKHKATTGQGVLRSFRIEDKSSGTGLIQTLKREGVPVQGIQRQAGMDKVARAMDAIPSIEAGMVMVPEDAPWLSDFMAEASSFPNGAHDDQIDPMVDAVVDICLGRGKSAVWMLPRG